MAPKSPDFTPPDPDKPCPCGSAQTFAACCRPILLRQAPAPDAERLMRSRFTAHVARDFEHLHRTVLETSQEPFVADAEAGGTNWTRLEIHTHEKGAKPDLAYVDFTAYYQEPDGEKALHEKAEFQRVNGTWFYTRALRQGPAPIRASGAKAGRNDPCPCGSGKKYKQCCLNK